MRDIKQAFPEGILPGEWDISEGTGSADMKNKTFSIPYGNKPSNRHVRNHEYFHVKFSPISKGDDLRQSEDGFAINAFEDARVNILGTDLGVPVSKAGSVDRVEEAHGVLKNLSPFTRLSIIISTWKLDIFKSFYNTLSPFEQNIVKDNIDKIIENKYDYVKMKKCAFDFVDLFIVSKNPPEETDEEECDGSEEDETDEEEEDEDEDDSKSEDNSEDNRTTEKYPFEDKSETPYAEGLKLSGTMETINNPMPVRNVWSKSRLSDTGYVFRHPERYYTDKLCFSNVIKSPFTGTILIDCSSSMSLNRIQLLELVKEGCGCLVAGYSGRSYSGNLEILSKNGHMVDKLPYFNGNNIIDLPALIWLSKQRGRKVWVSDGWVTGKNDNSNIAITRDCATIVNRYGVKNVRYLNEAIEYIQQIKKGYA